MIQVVTIIPARSGSKSLPNKNILPLNGIPLVCHTIRYSLKSELVAKTIVSTDSQEIAVISEQCGAIVPFIRPSEFAQDNTRDYPVIRHALDYFEAQGQVFDLYVLLRPTSPLRPPDLIEQAIDILSTYPEATSVRSVAKIKEHPYRTWKKNYDGSISGFIINEKEPYNIPRQELPPLYFQTGDIEVIRRSTIIAESVSGKCVYPLIIEHIQMIDIDNQADLLQAERRASYFE
jgi:CMP-N,N'-diacetyllegionaminic acid synthase